jgi:biopolymer transport protein ExbB
MYGEFQMQGGSGKGPALNAASRASIRAVASVHRDMTRGLNSLATIASIAPWLGLLSTVLGLASSFRGVDGSKESIMTDVFDSFSMAFVPCALGLMVALISLWFYEYLLTEVEALDSDMHNASLQLVNELSRLWISN